MVGSGREYVVLSRFEAEDHTHAAYDEPHALISIADPSDSHARIEDRPERTGILRLQFDGVSRRFDERDVCFDKVMAQEVAEFVLGLEPSVRLVVHCFAGISRSAGMVAGIAEALGDPNVEDQCHMRYMPNPLVQELMFEAIMGELEGASEVTITRSTWHPEHPLLPEGTSCISISPSHSDPRQRKPESAWTEENSRSEPS